MLQACARALTTTVNAAPQSQLPLRWHETVVQITIGLQQVPWASCCAASVFVAAHRPPFGISFCSALFSSPRKCTHARNLHACIHIRTPVCTALLHRLFFCPRLLCVRPCYRSRWTCAWKMLMRVSWLTKPDRAACFSFSPLHTHARTHAHTHARAHTHAHTHTHSSSHFAVFVPFSLHAFLSIKPGNPSSMLTPSSTLSTHTTDEMQSAKQRQAELDVLAADLPDTEPHRTLCLINNCKGLLLTISHLLQ